MASLSATRQLCSSGLSKGGAKTGAFSCLFATSPAKRAYSTSQRYHVFSPVQRRSCGFKPPMEPHGLASLPKSTATKVEATKDAAILLSIVSMCVAMAARPREE
ncbi:unnamed protein product [Polarella glacialis]|uniref:Uncharacterized protein n=1 Tax=Polarella glacialis TaxID=89957 RepID=A0A813J6H4_POLGL|nr:unnamed protein product [Polarella glacialis]